MKLIVVLVLVAAATAQEYVKGSDKDAVIEEQSFEEALDSSYQFGFRTSNNIATQDNGESLPGPEPETGTLRRSGEFSWVAPNGETILVKWVADENGYRATSESVPVGADGQAADGQAAAARSQQFTPEQEDQ